MQKKILSLSLSLCLIFSTLSPSAVEISFENLYIDDKNFSEEENILENNSYIEDNPIFENSSLKANENLFSESRITLLNLENENPIENLSIPENLDYTTVDITDVFTGSIISHDCNMYLISNFDEVDHWNECSVCGKILNIEEHIYQDAGWTCGNANDCSESNVHLFTCKCGMSYSNTNGKKLHNYVGSNDTSSFYFCRVCSSCRNGIDLHYCQKEDGSIINCSNIGRCSICNYNYSTTTHQANINEVGSAYCDLCNKYLGELTECNYVYTSDSNITFYGNAQIASGYTSLTYSSYQGTTNIKKVSLSNSGNRQTFKARFSTHMEYISYLALFWNFYLNGEKCVIRTSVHVGAEETPPVITNIISNTDDWTTDSTISITGTENYCNSVNLTLKDTKGNIYAENITAPVTSKNWTYEIKPSLESQENTEFILVVSDQLGNTTEQSFYLSKIDAIPPKAIKNETLNTDWSKTKDYIFTSSDYGIGQVHNSAISTDNYELATENENIFYKGYTFTGDVYGEIFVPVYMKDGLENTDVEFVSVSNLDNTAPSIEDIVMNKSLHNTEVVISANDINKKLNASGSGVTGYAISTENEIPDTFQEENTFNLTEAGTYYIFITDLVGNVTSKEIYIPVQYKVTINPDGGTWKGDTNPKEIDLNSDETINLYPEPEKEGYTFKEWEILGKGEITPDGDLIIGGDLQVISIWEINTYSVIYIDYNVTSKEELKRTTKELDYNTIARGFDIGSDTTDNAYYPQYKLISDTSVTVSTHSENNVVYRYFEFCYTKKESHINFNDNENEDGLRPDKYKLQLVLEDGQLIDEITLPTSKPDYTFENLPKYNKQGEEYNYKVIPIISDRYIPTEPDEDGNTTIIYSSPNCKILIPKTTTLDGRNGNLTYTVQVEANLFYKDKIILIPEEDITLTDGISNMTATITQDKTEFNKDDISNNSLRINGRIQTTKKHFAGTWHGTFNFKIKYEVKN